MAAAVPSALLQLFITVCLVLYSQAMTYTSNDIFHMDSGNCGTLYSRYGTLYSHASRHEVSKHSTFSGYIWCRLKIRVEVGRQIVLFAEKDDVNDVNGKVDLDGQGRIRIYDGVNNYPHWMWATSGSDPMPTLTTSSNLMTIEFYSNWDARGATGFTLFYSSYTNPPCTESEFSCWDGRCIDKNQQCDGHRACVDYSDEFDCPDRDSLIPGLSSTSATVVIFFIITLCASILIFVLYCTKKRKHRQHGLTVNVIHPGLPPPSPLHPPPGHMPMHPNQQTPGTFEMGRPEPPPYPVGNPEGMPVPPPPPILY